VDRNSDELGIERTIGTDQDIATHSCLKNDQSGHSFQQDDDGKLKQNGASRAHCLIRFINT
jgi:hypothetical protein